MSSQRYISRREREREGGGGSCRALKKEKTNQAELSEAFAFVPNSK